MGLVYYRCLSPTVSRNDIKQNNFYCVQRKFLHNSGFDLRRSTINWVWTSSPWRKKPWSWSQRLSLTENHRLQMTLLKLFSIGELMEAACGIWQWRCRFAIPSPPVGCTGVLEQCAQSWTPHKMRDIDKLGQLQSSMTILAMSQKPHYWRMIGGMVMGSYPGKYAPELRFYISLVYFIGRGTCAFFWLPTKKKVP